MHEQKSDLEEIERMDLRQRKMKKLSRDEMRFLQQLAILFLTLLNLTTDFLIKNKALASSLSHSLLLF